MKQISLSRGLFAIVDDQDFAWLSQWKWSASVIGYAVRSEGPRKKRNIIFMHKQIMGFPDNKVDHRNLNKIDNQRNNLRNCTHKQNLWNAGLKKGNTSGFKGICWDKNRNKWSARIRGENSKMVNIGRFDNIEDAIRVYNKKAVELRGEFAVLNQVKNEK